MNLLKHSKVTLLLVALVATLTLFNSCKRNNIYSPGTTFDNSKTTQGTIFGQVVAEDGAPLIDAEVRVGTNTFITGADGIFYFSKINTLQNATLITVKKGNYMTGYRTLRINTNKDHYARIMMIELKNPSTVNAISGGNVNINGGGAISFPANGIVYKDNGSPYNGTVTVYAKWLDPTGANLNQLMPGDLRAIDGNSQERLLTSFGMMGVELFDDAGKSLQIATNKTAKLTFPIPSSIAMNAPNSIPLWFFDAAIGMWKQEGTATKQGNNYVGDVKHFSFWNCDVPNNFIQLDMTLTNASGVPYGNVMVKITNPATSGIAYGYTNSLGFVSGAVPDNATLNIEVIMNPCNTTIYSQVVNTFSAPISLGTIIVTTPYINTATITGTVVDCMGVPVSNGFASVISSTGLASIVATNASGGFNTSLILCSLPDLATVGAYDMSSMLGNITTVSLNAGINNLGTLSACGTPVQFINWSSTVGATTTNYSIMEPTGDFNAVYSGTLMTSISGGDSNIIGSLQYINFTFDGLDDVVGAHNLLSFQDHVDPNSIAGAAIPVMLTNYQPIGGFISGNFSGIITGGVIPSRTVTCSFSVKR